MSPFNLLQPRRESLQAEYDLLGEKLVKLRRASAIVADESVKFQRQKEVEQTEAELERIVKSLESLERLSEDGLLYQALLKLGYRKQVQTFRRFIQDNPVAAFLIYGESDRGQRWLLNRLVTQHTRDSITGKVVKVKLDRIGRRSDVAALWSELGKRVGLGAKGSIPRIVERVYQWSETQNVLLIFHGIDYLPESCLGDLLKDFWCPLASGAKGRSRSKDYRLLMFLVDYEGTVGDLPIQFVENLNVDWKPEVPVKLPRINDFSESELASWLDFSADDLSLDLVDNVDETAQVIFTNGDEGVPELTFSEICRLSSIDWYDKEEVWMKL